MSYLDDEFPEQHGNFKYIRMPRSGKLLSFYDLVEKAQTDLRGLARDVSRSFKTINTHDQEYLASDLERIEWLLDDVEEWAKRVRDHLANEHGRVRRRERIAQLRNIAGRTPEEAEAFLAKADELERRERGE